MITNMQENWSGNTLSVVVFTSDDQTVYEVTARSSATDLTFGREAADCANPALVIFRDIGQAVSNERITHPVVNVDLYVEFCADGRRTGIIERRTIIPPNSSSVRPNALNCTGLTSVAGVSQDCEDMIASTRATRAIAEAACRRQSDICDDVDEWEALALAAIAVALALAIIALILSFFTPGAAIALSIAAGVALAIGYTLLAGAAHQRELCRGAAEDVGRANLALEASLRTLHNGLACCYIWIPNDLRDWRLRLCEPRPGR